MTTAGGAAGAAAADGEETVLLATPAHLNVNKLSRLLRREDVSAFNCLASIEADAAWVAGVSRAHAHLPVVANLRCGRWYVEAPDAECYFKSTDGHTGNWSFSLTRLNLHVASLAAEKNGVLVVDATRSATKRFPDALSKTLPIWAAVINAAVLGGAPRPPAFPPWVSPSEAAAVAPRIARWASSLAALRPDAVASLRPVLSLRPLRVAWVSRGEDGSPFTRTESDASSSAAVDAADAAASPSTLLFAVSASAPMRGRGARAAGFTSIPGAGDDEETWANGLTPTAFWAQIRARRGDCPLATACDATSGSADETVWLGDARAGGDGWRIGVSTLSCAHPISRCGAAVARVMLLDVGDEEARYAPTSAADDGAPLPPHEARTLRARVRSRPAAHDRASLAAALPSVVSFARCHLSEGASVVFCCSNGRGASAAVLAAVVATSFEVVEGGEPPRLRFVGRTTAVASKEGVRKALAVVAAHHHSARPSRAMLKQVFAFWGGGEAGDGTNEAEQ